MKHNSDLIGLTGGIGSGKSTAAALFEQHGITVVDADQASRDIVAPGSRALKEITDHFGDALLLPDGTLNRPALRKKIFDQPKERAWLEQLTHPLIRQRVDDLIAQSRSPYTLLMSPLLFETGQHQRVKKTILVDLPEHLQLERASARDNNSSEQIEKIMAAQMSRAQRNALADYIITNEGSLTALEEQVSALHAQLLKL